MVCVARTERNDELINIRKRVRMSVREFARNLGFPESTVHNWIYGGSSAIPDDAISKARGLTIHEVGAPAIPASELRVPVPYIGGISAGSQIDWTDPFDTESFEYVPTEMGDIKGRFCCRVVGDSMFDLLWPEDLCVFQRSYEPKIGVVQLFVSHPDGQSTERLATIKVCGHDGKQFLLRPVNPSYETIPARGDFYGYLVGIVREQGSRRATVYGPTGIRP